LIPFVWVKNQRRILSDRRRQAGGGHELRKFMLQHAAFASLFQAILCTLAGLLIVECWDQLFNINA
jgi:hypothetical protein